MRGLFSFTFALCDSSAGAVIVEHGATETRVFLMQTTLAADHKSVGHHMLAILAHLKGLAKSVSIAMIWIDAQNLAKRQNVDTKAWPDATGKPQKRLDHHSTVHRLRERCGRLGEVGSHRSGAPRERPAAELPIRTLIRRRDDVAAAFAVTTPRRS